MRVRRHLMVAVSVGLFCGSAASAAGDDLIMSTLDNFISYGRVDVDPDPDETFVGGFSITYVFCNIGSVPVTTIDCQSGPQCNNHPVYGQNVYRLRAGRFEQLGQSWLLHEFCGADASGPNCPGPCQNDGTCDSIGPGCTATHGAGLVADQANLGPKSEVNPWTGAFPYPFVRGWQQTGNAIFKRLQIHMNDVIVSQNPGARYFAEAQAIVPDEQASERSNNVSYRELFVFGSSATPSINFGSPNTVVQQPALRAWAASDPTVIVAIEDVTNDGRFQVASKATDLGNGRWHYEFAVYNQNCDRAAGSFAIPLPPNTTVSNIGFHDVDYHSGESYSGADWAATVEANRIVWRTADYATDPNANALRWGTLYNFRFDADKPPTDGPGTLGLFKPGMGDSVAIAARIPRTLCLPGDANCDSVLNNLDVDPFVVALVDNAAYLANPNWCGDNCSADVNQDGQVNFFDIDPFVDCLISGCP